MNTKCILEPALTKFDYFSFILMHSLSPMKSVSFSECVGGITQRGFFPFQFFLFLNILLD